MRRFAARALLPLALLLAGSHVRAADQPSANPFDQIVPLTKVGDVPPATLFVDQRGRRVRLIDLRGNSVAIAFVYTRCRDACPIITRKFGAVRALTDGAPVRLVEVTIDPSHDDLKAIAAYARQYGVIAPGWLVLTGAPADVDDFDRRMGVQSIATGSEEIVHNDRVALVSPDGDVADFIDGASWTPADLAAQLRELGGLHASLWNRIDLALGAAVAYCGGALSGRAGIGDLIASIAIIAGAICAFVLVIRKASAAHV